MVNIKMIVESKDRMATRCRQTIAVLILAGGAYVAPAAVLAQENVLDVYVREGLEKNLIVRQQQLSVDAAREQIIEVRGLYLPSLDLQARYTRSAGGRTIDFPVGDLLNPAYGALNQLLPGDPGFPSVTNEEIRFLREREQETRLRLTQPLFQPAARQNMRIQSALSDAAGEQLEATRRDVVAEIKQAYYRYLQADRAADILAAARDLVTENLRVSRSLFENGKATADAVFRAEAELSAVEQQVAEAATNRDLAASAFNLMLNRPLDVPVVHEDVDALLAGFQHVDITGRETSTLVERALRSREELRQLDYAARAANSSLKLARTSSLPNVAFALDYGIQGTSYSLSGDSDFRSASLVVSWNLFNGFQTRARTQQAQILRRQVDTRRERVSQQIALEVQDAQRRVDVAARSIETANDRLGSARQTFRLVQRRYEEGMASQIELLDARTGLTQAELNLTITQFDLLIRYAELERVAGL
jgi:outer membrane protein TolC